MGNCIEVVDDSKVGDDAVSLLLDIGFLFSFFATSIYQACQNFLETHIFNWLWAFSPPP